jgi:hypothetical protein
MTRLFCILLTLLISLSGPAMGTAGSFLFKARPKSADWAPSANNSQSTQPDVCLALLGHRHIDEFRFQVVKRHIAAKSITHILKEDDPRKPVKPRFFGTISTIQIGPLSGYQGATRKLCNILELRSISGIGFLSWIVGILAMTHSFSGCFRPSNSIP